MKIEKKWAVHETISDTYYAGNDGSGKPVWTGLDSGIKVYKSSRSAQGAVNIIMQSGFEGQVEPEYFEDFELPEAESTAPVESEKPVITDNTNWRLVDKFGKIKYWVRDDRGGGKEYAYTDRNGDMRWLGTDELAAWCTYSNERMEVGAEIIRSRQHGKKANA